MHQRHCIVTTLATMNLLKTSTMVALDCSMRVSHEGFGAEKEWNGLKMR